MPRRARSLPGQQLTFRVEDPSDKRSTTRKRRSCAKAKTNHNTPSEETAPAEPKFIAVRAATGSGSGSEPPRKGRRRAASTPTSHEDGLAASHPAAAVCPQDPKGKGKEVGGENPIWKRNKAAGSGSAWRPTSARANAGRFTSRLQQSFSSINNRIPMSAMTEEQITQARKDSANEVLDRLITMSPKTATQKKNTRPSGYCGRKKGLRSARRKVSEVQGEVKHAREANKKTNELLQQVLQGQQHLQLQLQIQAQARTAMKMQLQTESQWHLNRYMELQNSLRSNLPGPPHYLGPSLPAPPPVTLPHFTPAPWQFTQQHQGPQTGENQQVQHQPQQQQPHPPHLQEPQQSQGQSQGQSQSQGQG